MRSVAWSMPVTAVRIEVAATSGSRPGPTVVGDLVRRQLGIRSDGCTCVRRTRVRLLV
ncbi:hypothetical protein [Kribbella sp. NPDC006257]|uniref:hypothetical protein n=1 Tax=Kribbella sp. NPDC006257 TaxID=3156738 RepID=UPI00339ED081